ncbi:MAG: tRNA1(Val) (adenine(37)-N6)-methyltransferase [Desulfuromonas sp.]
MAGTDEKRGEYGTVSSDETLDQLRCGGLKLIQPRRGYRFSLDPVLLAHFATIKPYEVVLDMGSGCGVVALLVARLYAGVEVTGVEIQASQAQRACRSVRLNEMEGRVRIETADVCQWMPAPHIVFDRVVCNPPFRSPRDGRISAGDERSISRHEICGTLEDFIRAAARLLRPGGTLSMVHLPERFVDIVTAMRLCGLEPRRVRMVHSRRGEQARLLLIEARRGAGQGMVVEPPLYIYADGDAAEGEDGSGEGGEDGERRATHGRANYSAEVAGYYAGC